MAANVYLTEYADIRANAAFEPYTAEQKLLTTAAGQKFAPFNANARFIRIHADNIMSFRVAPGVAAVTAVNAFASGDDTDLTVYTTQSYNFQNNKLYTIAVTQRGTLLQTISSITGGGLTWVAIASATEPYDTIAAALSRVTVFRALKTAGATAGALTITCSGAQTGCSWSCDEWTGADITGTDGANAIGVVAVNRTDAAASLSVTLSTMGIGNASYGAFSISARAAVTPGAGYTLLGTGQGAAEARTGATVYKSAGDVTPNATFGSTAAGGVGVEIIANLAGMAATTDARMAAGQTEYFKITPGHVLSVITNT